MMKILHQIIRGEYNSPTPNFTIAYFQKGCDLNSKDEEIRTIIQKE